MNILSSSVFSTPAARATGFVLGASLMSMIALTSAPSNAHASDVCPVPCRVGGDLDVTVSTRTLTNGVVTFESGSSSVDSPLPVGYPRPTPPGAIEIKHYPVVRRAMTDMAGGSGRSAFWPLFNHIKDRGIAMTAPVEMDYEGWRPGDEEPPSQQQMSFLYRRPDQAPEGNLGRVIVADDEARTVISLGQRGMRSWRKTSAGLEQLNDWLADNPQWELTGDPRVLSYNGPSLRPWTNWTEVQLPIRRTRAE